jgi:hypothetical protein
LQEARSLLEELSGRTPHRPGGVSSR